MACPTGWSAGVSIGANGDRRAATAPRGMVPEPGIGGGEMGVPGLELAPESGGGRMGPELQVEVDRAEPRLHAGGPAAIGPPAADLRPERVAGPQADVTLRDDIPMAAQREAPGARPRQPSGGIGPSGQGKALLRPQAERASSASTRSCASLARLSAESARNFGWTEGTRTRRCRRPISRGAFSPMAARGTSGSEPSGAGPPQGSVIVSVLCRFHYMIASCGSACNEYDSPGPVAAGTRQRG